MRGLLGAIAIVALVLLGAAVLWTRNARQQTASSQPASGNIEKATATGAASPADDGNWTMPAKDYAATRFSGLTQITPANVAKLRVDFTFSTGTTEGFEAPPLVVGPTMYVVTPWPNNIFALDLTQPGAPAKWVYRPNPAAAAKGVACCGPVNRGASYWNGRIFLNLLDGNTVAIDAETGKEVWRTKLGDIQKGETITMAPLVAEGKVLVGNSGGEMGVRGWLAALDAGTGKLAWKAYSTGPDKDVLIGSGFHAPYAQDQGRDLGVTTWPPDYWKIGGGTVWGWVSYDPALKTIYYGTSNPGPWNQDQRPGDNKWTAGVFARDVSTGQARWFYQSTPHDLYDHDDINEIVLVDMPTANGGRVPALIRPDRNGFFY